MATADRRPLLMLVLAVCVAGAIFDLLGSLAAARPVELRVVELAHLRGGQAVLVLREKHGARRLAIPVSKAEGVVIEAGLRNVHGLAPAALDALGARVLQAQIDEISAERGFRAHLAVGSGSGKIDVDARVGEALALALQAGAPIVADPAVLDAAAISPEDLPGRTARDLSSDRTPAPVLGI